MQSPSEPRLSARAFWRVGVVALGSVVACNIASNLRLPDEIAGRDDASPAGGGDGSAFGGDAVALGETGTPTGDGASSTDGGVDEAGQDAADLCPINPCKGGNVCCYVIKSPTSGAYRCMAGCPNGDPPTECAGPQHCGGGTPYCCASVKLGPGTVPNCTVAGISSTCTGSCNPALGLGCSLTDTFRLCQVNADCAGDPAGNSLCCSYPGIGLSSLVCVSPIIKSTLGLPCAQ